MSRKDSDETYSTTNAIQRSKAFLDTKLHPDLRQATLYLAHLKQVREEYVELKNKVEEITRRVQLQKRGCEATKRTEEKDNVIVPLLAPLGRDVYLPAQIKPEGVLILVSSGLKESDQDWQTDSGLYLQLDQEETCVFAETKIGILDRRVKLALDKVALIEGHVELVSGKGAVTDGEEEVALLTKSHNHQTSKSIQQLEQLQANPQANLIDYLQA